MKIIKVSNNNSNCTLSSFNHNCFSQFNVVYKWINIIFIIINHSQSLGFKEILGFNQRLYIIIIINGLK